MFKTLAGLALAMTAGASLLAWLEPQPPDVTDQAARLANPMLVRHLARQAVQSAAADPQVPWQAVAVVTLTGRGPGGVTLAATLPPDDLHFMIARDGDLQALPAWQQQRTPQPFARVIRVGVMGRSPEDRVATAQWAALRALLAELAERNQPSAGSLPVRMEHTAPAGVAEAAPLEQHLHTLLVQDGFLG